MANSSGNKNLEHRGALFDMDGLLIDSEPFWASVEKNVFSELGITLTDKMCCETKGLRVIEVAQYWYDRHPWGNSITIEYVKERIIEGVREEILNNGVLMEGAYSVMEMLSRNEFRMAIASSSPDELIRAVISKFELDKFISTHISAETCIKGKPHPEVYQKAAELIGLPTNRCFAFEDSSSGILSASAAGATVVAVPESPLPGNISELCRFHLDSLSQFDDSFISALG